MTADIISVKCEAEIRQVKSMADHTYNITLNLPEYCGNEASWFLKNQLELIDIVAVIKPKPE